MKHLASAALLALWLGTAHAQLRLPSLPSLPSVPSVPAPTLPSPATPPLRADTAPLAELVQQRRQRIARLLQQRSDVLEPDPAGQPAVRGQMVLDSPSAALLAAARAEGFTVVGERTLAAFDMRLVTLRAPPGWDTPRAMARLRELDPQLSVDHNHLYLESGDTAEPAPSVAVPRGADTGPFKVGLIDGGVDTGHALLRDAAVRTWGCGGRTVQSAHGTAVASLLVGRATRFRSAAPAATLYAADVYCGEPTGGSVEAVAAALAWLAGEQVAVVNISLVGPDNRLLARVVQRATARGMLLVAAVGNDGPAAAPLYPAAYPGVVAVTAVDARGRVLPEAGRGEHVAFAAPGAHMAVAAPGTPQYATARGTSYAAPLVAGLLAAALQRPDAGTATLAVAVLARQATDLGTPGRDAVYGHGLVARDLRTDPR